MAERRLKAYIFAVAALATALVGASRIYLGVHYATDVLAGWIVGIAWALGCWLVGRWLADRAVIARDHRPPAPAGSSP